MPLRNALTVLLLLALVAVAGVGCGGGGDDGPLVVLRPEGRSEVRVHVELARTGQEKAQGLMFREHLDADAGMLFLYDSEGTRVFWMRNTLIPLDMIFISGDLQVVGVVENAEPQTDTPR